MLIQPLHEKPRQAIRSEEGVAACNSCILALKSLAYLAHPIAKY